MKKAFFCLFYIFFVSHICLADDEGEINLERITVSKSQLYLKEPYRLKNSYLVDSAFSSPVESLATLPIDLQARSPVSDIQTDLSLRASNFQQVLVLFNGQRINDPQTGHHNADIPLTKEDIESLELVPGAASSIFGPDSIGGLINFISKSPQENSVLFESSGGQDKSWSGLFSLSRKFKEMGFRLSVENQESDGFSQDTDFKKFTSSFASFFELPGAELSVDYGYQEKEFGAYDFYTPARGYPSREWTKTHLLNGSLAFDAAGFKIKPNFLWRRHFDKFMLDKTNQRSTYLNHHRTDIYTPNLYLQKELDYIGRLGLGLEYGEETINSTNLGKHGRKHKSIFLDDKKEISENFSAVISFRADDFDGFSKVYTGSLSAAFSLPKGNSLRFGVSRNMRIPSFTELYYSDPTTVGNKDLSAEKSLGVELGYEYKSDQLLFSLSPFLRKEKESIDWVKHTPAQARWNAENIAEATVSGAEGNLEWRMSDIITLRTNYAYSDKRTDKADLSFKYGVNYARHILNTYLFFNLPFGQQSIGLSYKKKVARSGWLLLNSRLNYSLAKCAQIFVAATNLFNVEYQEIEGIASPGRHVEAGLRLEW